MITPESAKDRWEQLATFRSQVLNRAERAAAVTLPHLMPPQGHTEGSTLPTPYQSLGAKAVNNLSAKILLALFPPNSAFFKLGFDPQIIEELKADGVDIEDVSKQMALIEHSTVSQLEQTRMRSTIGLAAKHLLVTGNYCLDVGPQLGFRGFGLKHFVVNRDPEGSVLELIIKEEVSPLSLPDTTLEAVLDVNERGEYSTDPEKTLDVYTVMQRVDGKYKVFQSIKDNEVPGSTGTYPLDAPRFLVLRWTAITDEDYGRGLVDEYYGDIKALDNLSRDLLAASALAAKVIFATDPNSHITPKKLEGAKSGDVLKGRADDVGTIGVDKLNDFKIVLDRLRDIQKDLSEAFLMHTSIQRNAERVTAEEIRFMAQELEDALGGVYSQLAHELQVPLVRRVLKLLADKGSIPKLPSEVQLTVTTGLEALGRGHEINKLMQFIAAAGELVGEEIRFRLDVDGILTKLATGLALNTDGVLLSEEESQQRMQQAQMQQVAAQTIPGVAQEAIRQGGTT